ncbi:MAG: nucleotidyltransferase domain-containing protein [Clostridiales bacterium]|jgi:predicted nucleotidyltransferase|nr:nucleotidyltransferase domain-containing protein [Clostridiales bacterium]
MQFNKAFDDFTARKAGILGELGLVCIVGSVAYGTNIPGKSDLDIRGWAFGSLDTLLGYKGDFEQLEDKTSDIVLYSLKKYIRLLVNNNPNCLESLGLNEEFYLFKSPAMEELMANLDRIISSKISQTIGGYARQQLGRLQSLNRKGDAIESVAIDTTHTVLTDRLKRDIIVRVTNRRDDWHEEGELRAELLTDISGLTLKEVSDVTERMKILTLNYNKLDARNRKVDETHMNKHAMHICRLLLFGSDILKTGQVRTCMTQDHDLLMSIRNGEFQEPNGLYGEKFDKLVAECEKRFGEAKATTKLRSEPDMEWINEFQVRVLKEKVMEMI